MLSRLHKTFDSFFVLSLSRSEERDVQTDVAETEKRSHKITSSHTVALHQKCLQSDLLFTGSIWVGRTFICPWRALNLNLEQEKAAADFPS